MDKVVFYDEMCEILCRSVCSWAGIPLQPDEVKRRTAELTAMYTYAGTVGLTYWWSRLARYQSNQ